MPNKIVVANPSKAALALVGMVCVTILLALDAIATEAGTGMLGAVIGYAIGNGIAAGTGKSVDPIVGFRK